MTGISIAEILLALEARVKTWTDANKGKVSIASDVFNVVEVLELSPSGVRVVLFWGGDDVAGEVAEAGVTTNELHAIITHNRGLAKWQGRNVVETQGAREPLFKLLSALRAHIQGFVPAGGEVAGKILYKGSKPYAHPEGLPLDAYDMTFLLDAAIEAEEEESEASQEGSGS